MGHSPSPGLIWDTALLLGWSLQTHFSSSGQQKPDIAATVDKTLQSQRQHAGSNQCWLVFGEILGLSTLFDSVFPAEAIPSHPNLGLEGGNSHSCLPDSAISAGRQGPLWSREENSRSPKVLNPGPCFQAGSRRPHSWARTSSNNFLA